LIARKNYEDVIRIGVEMDEVSSHRIRSSLIPIITMLGLFCRQYFNKAFPEAVKSICVLNMPMQRRRIELAEQINTIVAGIQAVADWYVDQPVLAGKWDGWLTA
jgi:hypothetical protein